MAFRHVYRPDWDRKNLPALGYTNVRVTPRINERVYPAWKRELYDAMDLFFITADKP